MEYVKVTYPNERTVRVDEDPVGKTNQTLEVEKGTHTFDLGDPNDYTPSEYTEQINRTTNINPREIAFTPVDETT